MKWPATPDTSSVFERLLNWPRKDPEAVAVQFTHYADMTDEERKQQSRRWGAKAK